MAQESSGPEQSSATCQSRCEYLLVTERLEEQVVAAISADPAVAGAAAD